MVKINRKDKAKITNIERERYHGPLITHGVILNYIHGLAYQLVYFYILVGAMRIILALLKKYFLYALLLM